MTLQEVKKACNDLLAAEFPEIEVYNGDTLDGYQRPSFFTEILTRGAKARASPYITEVGYTFKITYFEWIHREADCLELYERICDRFGIAVAVGDRKLVVEDVDYQWIDEHQDKMQITIRFQRMTQIRRRTEEGDLMETLELSVNRKEDENGST